MWEWWNIWWSDEEKIIGGRIQKMKQKIGRWMLMHSNTHSWKHTPFQWQKHTQRLYTRLIYVPKETHYFSRVFEERGRIDRWLNGFRFQISFLSISTILDQLLIYQILCKDDSEINSRLIKGQAIGKWLWFSSLTLLKRRRGRRWTEGKQKLSEGVGEREWSLGDCCVIN